MKIVAMLLVKLSEAIKICQVGAGASFYRIELLFSGPEMEFLCVNGKLGIPGVRRDNLANSELRGLGSDLAHVLEGIPPFLLGRAVGRSLVETMGPTLLDHRFADSCGLASSLNGGQVEGCAGQGTEWCMRLRRMVAVGVDLGLRFGRRVARCCADCG